MTFISARRATALILMITIVGSTLGGAFPRAAFADDGGDAPIAAPTEVAADTSTPSAPADALPEVPADTDAAVPPDPATTDVPAVTTEPASTTVPDHAATGSDDTTTTPAAPSGDSIATTSSSVPTDIVSSVASGTPPTTEASTTAASTTPTIQTGDAIAVANILNIVNTNIVNSTGAVVLGNYFEPATSTIDLRGSSPFGALACNLISCDTGGITIHVGDNASIDNAIVLSADTGGNDLQSNTDGVIKTGNAFAGLNLINLANTNIIDSNYLLVTLNAFQGLMGDIVFPSLTNFLSSLAQIGGTSTFSVDPTASVQNDVTAAADSGGNTTQAASSTIATGSAQSAASIFNRINAATIGGGNVSVLFRIQGNWAGEVFGAPAGLNMLRGSDGSLLLYGASSGSGQALSNADITGSSTANIHNAASVTALTGNNHADAAGTALITTGNALASANVVNVANTNIVGKNWILAVVNIFGDFTGNIAFGRPDLWVGEQVSVPSFIQDGSDITYTYSVVNKGDSDASNAVLTDTQDLDHLAIADASVPYTSDADGHLVWQLGTIPAGGSVEVSYRASAKNTQPGMNISNSVSVGEHETDNNIADNSDSATITASIMNVSSAPFANTVDRVLTDFVPVFAQPDLSGIIVERGTAATTITSGEHAHQILTIRNTGKAASPELTVNDVLRDQSGTIISSQSGSVGALAPGDSVTIEYDLAFAADAPPGMYVFSTTLTSGDLSATAKNNGTLVVEGKATVRPAAAHASAHSIASLIAGSLTTKVAHASEGNDLAAAAGSAGISWQLALILFLVMAVSLGTGLTVRRMRHKRGF